MAVDIRPLRDDEQGAYWRGLARAFGFDYREDRDQGSDRTTEVDRSIAAWDGNEMVGTAGIYTYRMTVPGWGTRGLDVGTAGVTHVTVRETHRRRGILTSMMSKQLDDVRERGEPVAALWASEAPIYGRFGYGCAFSHQQVSIDRPHAILKPLPAPPGIIRLLSKDEARGVIAALWESERAERPGMMTRSEGWLEERVLDDPGWVRAGYPRQSIVSYEEAGVPIGYARYRMKGEMDHFIPDGKLRVDELIARTPAAHAALWRHVFGVDLVSSISCGDRPMDEPLPWLVSDPRRLIRRPHDALWLRLLDIPAALASRRYATEDRLVLDVHDGFVPGAGGCFALEGSPAGAICKPATAQPDLALGASALASMFLGGVSPVTLHEAGFITGTGAAVRRAAALFAADRAAWCPDHF
jgi:predicted acetyltransferase